MKKNSAKSSSISIGSSNKFGDGNVIGHNNEVIINQDNNVTYEGDKENNFILQIISPVLIRKYGKKNVGITGFISFISGLITISTWFNSLSENNLFPFLPSIDTFSSQMVLYLGLILVVIGILLFSVITYHSANQCKKCKEEFAYDENRDPTIEEVKTVDGTKIKTTRYYKCKFCGYEETAVIKRTVENSES